MRRDSSAEYPSRPLASHVLGRGRLSCSVIREEDRGHTEDGREGGVHAAGYECDSNPQWLSVSETQANTTKK